MPLFEKVFSSLRTYVHQNLVPKMEVGLGLSLESLSNLERQEVARLAKS